MTRCICFVFVSILLFGGDRAIAGLRGPKQSKPFNNRPIKEKEDKRAGRIEGITDEVAKAREVRLKASQPDDRQEAAIRERQLVERLDAEKQNFAARENALDADLRGMAESKRRMRAAVDEDLKGAEESRKQIQRGLDADMRGEQAQRERIQRAMDEDMKYGRRGHDDEAVRASRTGIESYKKRMAGDNYGDPKLTNRLDEKVKELLSNPGARINDDGSVTISTRPRGQQARARNGSAQSSRTTTGSTSGKRSFSASQIKAIYAKGDN